MNGITTGSSARDDKPKEAFVVKASNIRIWIHDQDIGKLTKVLWAGQGNRLRAQASNNPRIRKFLDAVPHVLNVIRDIHQAVIDNDLEILQLMMAPRSVPRSIITSKDQNGLTVMHKAAGLGHSMIVEYLTEIWPDGASDVDGTGKTPLHWAASVKNNTRCYNLLVQAGAYEDALDYKMKIPAYYKTRPSEVDRSLLTIVPDAPRIPRDSHTDWSALMDENAFDFPMVDHIKSRFERQDSDAFGNSVNKRISRSRGDSIENTSEPDFYDGEAKMSVEEEALEAAVEEEKIVEDEEKILEETVDNAKTESDKVNGNEVFSRGESPILESEMKNESPLPELNENYESQSADIKMNEDDEAEEQPEPEPQEQQEEAPEDIKTNVDDLSTEATAGEDQQSEGDDKAVEEGDNDVEDNKTDKDDRMEVENEEKYENDDTTQNEADIDIEKTAENIENYGGNGRSEENGEENAEVEESGFNNDNENSHKEMENNEENEGQEETNAEIRDESETEPQSDGIENDHHDEQSPDDSTNGIQNGEVIEENEDDGNNEENSKENNEHDKDNNEENEKQHVHAPNGDKNDFKEIHEDNQDSKKQNGAEEEDDDDQVQLGTL